MYLRLVFNIDWMLGGRGYLGEVSLPYDGDLCHAFGIEYASAAKVLYFVDLETREEITIPIGNSATIAGKYDVMYKIIEFDPDSEEPYSMNDRIEIVIC